MRAYPCWPHFQTETALRQGKLEAKTAGRAGPDPGGVKHGGLRARR